MADSGYKPPRSGDKVDDVRQQVDAVKMVMRENIDLAIDRQEALTSLEDKSESLMEGAHHFHKGARRVVEWRTRQGLGSQARHCATFPSLLTPRPNTTRSASRCAGRTASSHSLSLSSWR